MVLVLVLILQVIVLESASSSANDLSNSVSSIDTSAVENIEGSGARK